jgi:hypothetical protein
MPAIGQANPYPFFVQCEWTKGCTNMADHWRYGFPWTHHNYNKRTHCCYACSDKRRTRSQTKEIQEDAKSQLCDGLATA